MIKTNYILSILSVLLIFSCSSDSDKVIDGVLDGVAAGAVLRTLNVNNAILNSSEPESEFSVTIEEQDEQDGGLFESVGVYVSINDLTPDNGTTPSVSSFIKEIPASAFSPGPLGLPRGTITANFGEAANAMGLTSADYAPGDSFIFELRLNLTDGRVFGQAQAGPSITGGFFSSPFAYTTLILCSPAPGDYVVEMHDSYGDGWQTDGGNGGSGITVDVDGTIIEVGMCSPYEASAFDCTPWPTDDPDYDPTSDYTDGTAIVTIPVGTAAAVWNFPGDEYGEISFEVYGPNGELLYAGAQGATDAGLLPITLCAE